MFDSLSLENGEDFLKKMYQFFFAGPIEQKKSSRKLKMIDSNDQKVKNLQSDEEEKRKRAQLKMDLELIEFEERGGFAKVLKDIFNPLDKNAMELDSVY